MNERDLDAHFLDEPPKDLTTSYANGENGFPQSIVQAGYWCIKGPKTPASINFPKFPKPNSSDQALFATAYQIVLNESLIVKLDQSDLHPDLYDIATASDNPVIKYWFAGRLEEAGSLGRATLLLSGAITIGVTNLDRHFLTCCYAAIIRLSPKVNIAKTIVAGLLFDDRFEKGLLRRCEVEIKARNNITGDIHDPFKIAERLLFLAISDVDRPDPNAVLNLASAYFNQRFLDDIERGPEMAARILCKEFFRVTGSEDKKELQYTLKARQAFRAKLEDIFRSLPDSPEVNHYMAKVHLYEEEPDLAYECILRADSVLFVKPQLLYDIGCLIESLATGENRTPRYKKAVEIFDIAVERGSIQACQKLATFSENQAPGRLIELHSRALLIAYLLCLNKPYRHELQQLLNSAGES